MSILHYFFDGIEYATLPDPFEGVSPMTEERFVEMGGEIKEAEHLTTQEQFLVGLDEYLDTIEEQAKALGLTITKEDFKVAAATMMSSDLIAWAKSKEVPNSMIESVRNDILVMIADASRIGMTWADIFPASDSAPAAPAQLVQGELF